MNARKFLVPILALALLAAPIISLLAPTPATAQSRQGQRVTIAFGPYADTVVDHSIFVADRDYRLVELRAVWATAGGAAAVLQLEKCASGTAPGSGTDLLATSVDLTATASTPVQRLPSRTAGVNFIPKGRHLAIDIGGTLTGLVGLSGTIVLEPSSPAPAIQTF